MLIINFQTLRVTLEIRDIENYNKLLMAKLVSPHAATSRTIDNLNIYGVLLPCRDQKRR